jgi:endonuclease-3
MADKRGRPQRPAGKGSAGNRTKKKKAVKLKKGAELEAHALEILARLKKEYPDAHCELDFETPLQLLIATILSAQCTDKRVNMVTPDLFRTFPDAESLSNADPEKLEEMIKSTGFFRNKTKSLLGMSAAVANNHGGQVPATMEELVELPGVGRKTANVVLGNAFHINEGVVVDTHVGRLSVRLGLTNETDPVKVEQILMSLIPRDDWTLVSHLLIFHGRRVCDARLPRCESCVLADVCPSARV